MTIGKLGSLLQTAQIWWPQVFPLAGKALSPQSPWYGALATLVTVNSQNPQNEWPED
jgi:hypothetical protein